MTQGWEDSHFDVTYPDLGLLMPDCPAELSIQSHGLMLNVRRSVQLSRSREGSTASPWTHVSREVKLLRRVKSFQQPAVSTSIVPTLSRIRSFFDFSHGDTVALDSAVSSSILPQTGHFDVDKDGHQIAEEEKEEEMGSNEAPASLNVKPNFEDAAAEAHHLDRDVEEEFVCANGDELDKTVLEATDTAKVDANETIKKFESAFREALNVGSLKIDVRERIKRIQTAFEGFIPWDSGPGKPRGELSGVIAGDPVIESVKPVVTLTTSQNAAGDEIQQGRNIRDMKGELPDSSVGFAGQACNPGFVLETEYKEYSVHLIQEEEIIRSMEEGGLDKLLNQVDEVQVHIPKNAAIENPAPDGTNDEVEQERAIVGMEDGGSCNSNEVKEVASGNEVVNPSLSDSDAFSQEETLFMENEETELSAVDEVDEVQAVILDFEAIVAVRDTFGELQRATVNSDRIEERVVECQGVIAGDSSCEIAASKSVGVQCDVVHELMQEESPQRSDRLDVTESSGYTPVASMVDDASGELNQIVKEMNEERFQDSSEVEKVHEDLCREIATWNSDYLDDDNIVIDKNTSRSAVDDHPIHDEVDKLDVHEQEVICKVMSDKEAKTHLESDNIVNKIAPRSAFDDLPFHDEAGKLDVHEEEVICKVVCDEGAKDWNAFDNAQPNALWDSVSALPLDTQIAANSHLTQETFAMEMKANGLKKPSIKVDWVQLEAVGDSKETTDISGLPSPLSQLLDYRNGSAFTFLNVQDHLPDVGECLLHEEEEICYIKPGYLSREIDLRPLSPISWCSQKGLMSPSNGVENSDTGRSKVTINLRRLRIRKAVCLKALKTSSSKMRYRTSDTEIPDRLPALDHPQDLKIEEGASSLIAPRSNRSTDDAETKLDKSDIVDMNISLTSVQKHLGLLPDRELLNLLNYALSADTANTTKMVNEILASSVEPLLLVSRLGILITNILVENFDVHREAGQSGFCRPSYSRKQTQRRLRQALKILSQAEEYVRVSTDSMTWLTAALLQCESDRPFPPPSIVGSLADTLTTPRSKEQRLEMLISTDVGTVQNEIHPIEVSKLATEEAHEGHGVRTPQPSMPRSDILEPSLEKKTPVVYRKELRESWALEAKETEEHKQAPNLLNSQEAPVFENFPVLEGLDSSKLWKKVLQELTSSNLRHLLLTQGRLVSAVMANDGSRVIVEVEFQYAIHKHKAERSWRSICTAFQSVLRVPIELKISLQKNVLFDEGLLPRNLDGMDGEERDLLTQHLSRLNQEAEVVSYSTDSHCGSHSKRRRRRAPKDWQFEELIEPERKPRHSRSDSWMVPEPIAMQLTPRYKVRERPSAQPIGKEWHDNTFESSFSESQEQHSGNLETMQSRLPGGRKKIKRPRLRTMLDTPLYESDTNQDIRSYCPEQMPADFRTDRGFPLEAVCFPCTRRETQSRQKPTCHVEDRRQGDSMDRRGRAQGQTFFLRLLPCKSISTVRF